MELKYTRALLPGMFLDYDCVIIPRLGGFVCNERAAWYDEERAEMVPPSRDVLFNPNLIHNDGLLAQEIIRSTGMAYSEAMKVVESEADYIAQHLKSGNSVEIDRVGRLYSGDDGITRFVPDSELVRVLSSFGHSRIPLAKLQAQPEVQPQTQPEVKTVAKMVPMNRRLMRVAAILSLPLALGAILGGAYMISEPSSSNILLGIFPAPEAIISTFAPSEGGELEFINSEEEVMEDFDIDYIESPAPELVSAPVIETRTKVNFLIVGGAFSIEANAHTLADQLIAEGYSPTFHFQRHNRLHLVALGEFEKEGEARRAMARARKTGRHG
jgi:hypothetical protein